MSRRWAWLLAVGLWILVGLPTVLQAKEYQPQPGIVPWGPSKEGDVLQRVSADLNHDGLSEMVVLKATDLRLVDGRVWGCSAVLVVLDQAQRPLWQSGPGTAWRPDSPVQEAQVPGGSVILNFGDVGVTYIEFIGDLDGDGAVECVIEGPQSDVRPKTWQILRWNGREFVFAQKATLLEWPLGSGRFQTGKLVEAKLDRNSLTWINRFRGSTAPGLCLIEVVKFGQLPGNAGEAIVRASALNSFRVDRWVTPLTLYPAPADDLMLPKAVTAPLTEPDLAGRSAKDLSLIRNEIYARHGRPFKDQQLHSYFQSKKWYVADPAYTDARLTDVEKRNAKFISDYQQKHGLVW